MINPEVVYRNTCCACCGIPQVSQKYFQKLDGTLVVYTVDHDTLRSLGGSNSFDNLVSMCYDCNQTRSNLFAELQQFIDWYWSDTPLPVNKNFSYLNENPNYLTRNKVVNSSTKNKKATNDEFKNIPVLVSKNKSVPTRIVQMNGSMYQEYSHPLFGKSLIKIEE